MVDDDSALQNTLKQFKTFRRNITFVCSKSNKTITQHCHSEGTSSSRFRRFSGNDVIQVRGTTVSQETANYQANTYYYHDDYHN